MSAEGELRRSNKRAKRLVIAWRLLRGCLGPRVFSEPFWIYGPKDFQTRTQQALALLEQKAPGTHRLMQTYIFGIVSTVPSGVYTFQLAQSRTLIAMGPKISECSTIEYAAALAHEMQHCEQYVRNRIQRPAESTGQENVHEQEERACLDYQCQVLRMLGADERLVQRYKEVIYTRWWEVPFEERNW